MSELTDEQRASFAERGYLVLDRIAADDEIEWLRGRYDEIFARRTGAGDGRFVTCDAPDGEPMQQVLRPEADFPDLLDASAHRTARALAADLLGVREDELAEEGHLVYKPPGCGRETPWHQDTAYCVDPHNDYNSVSVWMPLDEATVESGCMAFIPGSHRDERRHRRQRDDSYVLVVDELDESQVVACPLAPGAATVHHSRTVHYAGPNTTPNPRRVYVYVFDAPPVPRAVPAVRPWLQVD